MISYLGFLIEEVIFRDSFNGEIELRFMICISKHSIVGSSVSLLRDGEVNNDVVAGVEEVSDGAFVHGIGGRSVGTSTCRGGIR